MPAKPIPDGYEGLIPSFVVDDATEAIEFYKRAFGATERVRMPTPDGKVAHAELEIGDSVVMLADPFPQSSLKTPKQLGGTTMGCSSTSRMWTQPFSGPSTRARP